MRAPTRFTLCCLATAVLLGTLSTAQAQNNASQPVGSIVNFGPNLQQAAGGVCRQPEGIAFDGDGNLYLASNSDTATSVGHVCVLDKSGKSRGHHQRSCGTGRECDRPGRRTLGRAITCTFAIRQTTLPLMAACFESTPGRMKSSPCLRGWHFLTALQKTATATSSSPIRCSALFTSSATTATAIRSGFKILR